MHVLGLIPARGGSKSIPRKNIVPLAGRPLLAYTCQAALESRSISRVVISTDDEEIAQVARECGVEAPFLRPAELASDTAQSIDVALHAVDFLQESENWSTDVLVLLQPTSPLRTARHVDEAMAARKEAGAETVVSVVDVPHRYSPYSIMELSEGRLSPFWTDPLPFDRFRRQDVPVLYARNGPAVLATRSSVLREKHSFYGDLVVPYIMEEAESLDIDGPLDLELAEFLLARRGG